jgi:hypothetical protein
VKVFVPTVAVSIEAPSATGPAQVTMAGSEAQP